MREPKACVPGTKRCIPDNHPSSPRKTLVEDFGHHPDVGVGVCCGDKFGVDVCDPKLGEGGIQGWEGEGWDVEE